MARVDEDPEDRFTETVKVEQICECPNCQVEQSVTFDTGELDIEMVDSEIFTDVTCVSCGHKWTQEYEGWTAHTDAG